MPSVSKSQQRLMGVAYAVKSGSMELKDVDAEYRDKVASLVDGMTKKDLKKYASTKHDKLPETVDEDFAQAAQNITPSANIGGMGPVVFPTDGQVGSGDVPAGPQVADIDDDEEEAKKDKTKKKLEMESFGIFTQFNDFLNEAFEDRRDLVKDLHFETDPEIAQDMKIEIGKRQGEVTLRKQIEGGEYSLKRFRKDIKYGDGKDLGVFLPGSYAAATSKLGDGPHKKAVAKVKWNRKKYDQWIEDVASNDGWKNAYDMAQNAKHEPGLLQWAKKEFRGEDVYQRIQWDIEAFAESVQVTEKYKAKDIIDAWEDAYGEDIMNSDHADVPDDIDNDYRGRVTIKDLEEIFDNRYGEELSPEFLEALGESVVTEAKLKFKVGDFIKQKKGSNFEYEIKSIDPKFDSVEVYLDVTGKTTNYTIKHINKDWELAESVVNEKKLDRDDMIKFVEKYMDFVKTSEEFNGSEGGIWVSGENMDEFKGQTIYDYYAEGRGYELGVNVKWEKELNKRGWYSEWYDVGTVQIWPI